MKLSKLALIAFFTLISVDSVWTMCGEGTLACNMTGDNADTPAHCDIKNHYMLSTDKKSCEKKKVDGCEIAAYNETTMPCLMCEAGKVFDSTKKKCMAVAADKKVEKCLRYKATDSSCMMCEEGNYLSVADSKCVAVEKTVANCSMYSDKTTCSSCKMDFYMKDKTCVDIPKVENCYKVTDRVCGGCEDNYFLNKGWNQPITVNDTFLGKIQNGALSMNMINTGSNQNSVCQKKILTNCSTFASFNTCSKCAPSYFLNDSKKCERYPEKAIANCMMYSNNVTCIRCKDNFYVDGSPTTCKAVTTVENCKKYKYTSNKCGECNDTYYLNEGENKCVVRTKKTIANCTTLDKMADGCMTCADNFSASTPKKEKCLANIANCKSGKTTIGADSATKHTCSECKDATFYIDNDGMCKTRNVTKCKTYEGTTNNCSMCMDNYWLDSKECKGVSVQNCMSYVANKNECQNCKPKYNKVNATTCTLNNIPDCTAYTQNTNTCTACSGDKVVISNECKAPNVDNCAVYVSKQNKCQTCQTGYYVTGNGACAVQAKDNCVEHKLNLDECMKCSIGYYIDNKACKANTAENCATYADSKNECASCSKGFYFSSNSCVRQNLDGCVEYQDNLNTCTVCQAGKYKNGSSCINVSKANCIEYTPNTNTCTKCALSHYLNGSGDSAACVARNKENCVTYDGNTNNCTKCAFGFKVDNNGCVPVVKADCMMLGADGKCTSCMQGKYPNPSGDCVDVSSITGCKTYKTDENKCAECEDGRYTTDQGATCPQKSVANCMTYTAPKTENKCAKCVPTDLKKLVSGGASCGNITTSTDCFSSPGTADDKCDKCVPGKFISGSACSQSGTAAKFDPNCAAHSNTSDTTNCTDCKSNHMLGTGLAKEAVDLASMNCNQLKSSDGKCQQCKLDYVLGNNKSCTQYSGDSKSLVCRQHIVDNSSALTVATNCHTCNWPSLLFKDSNECKSRDHLINMPYCAKYNLTSNACLACETGSYANTDTPIWGCDTDANVGTSTNCAVFGAKDQCKVCEKGKKLDGTNCVNFTKDFVSTTFKADMTPAPSMEVSTEIAECAEFIKIRDGVTVCSKCKDNFVAIVDYNKSNSTTLEFGFTTALKGFTGSIDIQNEVKACVAGANSYQKTGTKAITNQDDCIVGFKSGSDTAGYACLQCKPGEIGEIDTVNQLSDGSTAITPAILSISKCENQANGNFAKRLLHFMGDIMPSPTDLFPRYNAYFPYDSCVDASNSTTRSTTKSLVYMMFPEANGALSFVTKKQSGPANTSQYYCVPNNMADVAHNCAFFILKEDFSTTDFDGPGGDYKGKTYCGSCMPGYKPVMQSNRINQCVLIPTANHDNAANKNTWMNRAQTPKHDGWKFDAANFMIDFGTPVTSAQKIANCLAVDIDNSMCAMCKEGWSVWGMGCVPNSIGSPMCENVMGFSKFDIGTDNLKKTRQYSSLVVLRELLSGNFNTSKTVTPYCSSCSAGNKPKIFTTQYKMCEKKTAPGGAAQNCKYTKHGDPSKCFECNPSHTKNTTSETCIGKITNCKESNNGTACSMCDSGYVKDGNNCVMHYCKEWNPDSSSQCLICNDGKALDGSKKTHCSSSALSDSDCANISPVLGHCVKSKTSSKVPYVIKEKSSSGTIITATEYITYTVSGNGYNGIMNEYIFVEVMIDRTNSNAVMGKFQVAMTQMYMNSLLDAKAGNQPANSVCLPHRTLTDCADGHDGLFCKMCQGTKMPNNKGQCVEGNINNCAKYNENGCMECEANFFLNSAGSGDAICKNNARTKSDGSKCATKVVNKDECATCAAQKYLDGGECKTNDAANCAMYHTSKKECTSCYWNRFNNGASGCSDFTAKNCKSRESNQNKCAACEMGFQMSSNVCVVSTATNCMTWHATDDKCATCSKMFILSTQGNTNGKCVNKTSTKCKTFSTSADACDTCPPGYVKSSNNCVWGNAKNCASFKTSDANMCENCSPMYFKSSNNCVPRKATGCGSFVSTASTDQCQTCGDTFYKNGNNCAKLTEKHCKVAKGTEDKCQTCLGGFEVQSDACAIKSTPTCMTYTNDDKCASCSQGKYLNGSKACVNNEATNCAMKSTTANECATCAENFYKDSADANKCKSNTAQNCATKSQSKNECAACSENFYKDSADANKCKSNAAVNCKTKSQSKNECATCKDMFYKDSADGNKCKAHTAKNCKTYHLTSDECLTCKENMLAGSSSGKKTCSAYTTPNCMEFSPSKDECSNCTKDKYYKHNNGSKVVCSARKVTNCDTFNEGEDKCLTCKQKTYLKEGKCMDVTSVDQCKMYSIAEDMCSTCNDGYYKSGSKNECWLYPDGIDGCMKYTNRTTCLACDDKNFLASNKCEKVTTAVTDCMEYSSATNCKTCKAGKLLASNKCETITAQNCKEYTDKDTCKSCMDPYVFNTTNKKCEANGITDCKMATYASGGNTCDMCNSGKVLSADKKKCESPTTSITNCMDYSNKTKCSHCKVGFILSSDGTGCATIGTQAGANCAMASIVSNHVCDVCRFGFKKDKDGKCMKIELDYCLIPSEDGKKCLLCAPSSYMDKTGKCMSSGGTKPKSISIWNSLLAMTVSLFLLAF